MAANDSQVAGSHYKSPIQHWDYVVANDLDYFQAQITKYVTRWKKKNKLQDLQKAKHFLEKYMELAPDILAKIEDAKSSDPNEWAKSELRSELNAFQSFIEQVEQHLGKSFIKEVTSQNHVGCLYTKPFLQAIIPRLVNLGCEALAATARALLTDIGEEQQPTASQLHPQ